MQPSDFLTTVLPSAGVYCVCELTQRRHIFDSDLATVEEWAARFDAQGKETYFALASFKDDESGRLAENAAFMRSLFIDIDCAGRAYATKREGIEALNDFLQKSQLAALGEPWLVDSGGGVHAYWPLDADAAVDDWRPVAEALKRACAALGFKIDMTVTADAARVLRLPGTHNRKYERPQLVAVKHRGTVFSLDALRTTLQPYAALLPSTRVTPLALPGTRPGSGMSAIAKAMAQDSVTVFKHIMRKTAEGKGCLQLQYYVDHAADDGMEPLWRGWVSIANKCEDGWKAAVKLSDLHPYDHARLQRKWDEVKGPYPCTKFDSENPGVCQKCQHWGKITNPLALGREIIEITQTEVVNETTGEVEAQQYPPLPQGYFYSPSGVWRRADERDLQIVPYVMYLQDTLREDGQYFARFCRVGEANNKRLVVLPLKAVASKEDTIKKLAEQNVLASYGAGNDKHLFDFIRSSVMSASAEETAVKIPPRYGWQDDGGFAFGDTVATTAGEYTFASERLDNLIQSMQPKGTLAEWQRIMHMLCAKGCYDVVGLACMAFGSPLMQWANNGADAFVLHATSRASGVGKSLALSLARSVWGNRRMSVVPKTSENTMLQRAGFLGGLPLLVDEVTNKNRNSEMEWIPNFIFDYTQGQHKLKGSGAANAELNSNMVWSGLSLLTSNSPVLEHMLGSRATSSNGEVMRFLEWRTEKPLIFTTAERSVLMGIEQNYGHAGPAFARWLVRNQDTAREVYARAVENWRLEINATDAERYWVSGVGAIVAAAVLLGPRYANLAPVNVKRVVEFYKGLVENARALIGTNATSALDVLDGFLREFNASMVKVNNRLPNLPLSAAPVMPDSVRGSIVGRIETGLRAGWVDIYIAVPAIRGYCAPRNWSYQTFKSELASYYVVRETTADLGQGAGAAPIRTRVLHIAQPISTSAVARQQAVV